MPSFAYQAVDAQGAATRGVVEADDRGAALASIESSGLIPVTIDAATAASAAATQTRDAAVRSFSFRRGVRNADVLAFLRQLGNLLSAGVPLARALKILTRETTSPTANAQWTAIRDTVVDGTPLADAMAQFPDSFPRIHLAMIRAGEAGGFLDVALKQIADFVTRERELKGKVGAALIYPCLLAVVATAVVVFLLAWFIPRFSAIFEEFGQSLPMLTLVIQAASDVVRSYGLFVVIALAVAALAARQAMKTDKGRRAWDRYLLRLPAVGTVAARFALVRFSRMLGTLLGAGVPLIASLRVAKQAVGNQTLTDALDEAIADVQEGGSLSRSLSRCESLFPPSVIEMVAVAEESGRLPEELVRMSQEFEEDLDRRLRVLVSLAEPLLLLVMATLVGLIVIGMLLPVFDLWDAVQ